MCCDGKQMGEQHHDSLALSEAALAHMVGGAAGAAALEANLAWAGASHWRYRTRGAAAKPAASGDTAESGTAKAPSKCAPETLSCSYGPPGTQFVTVIVLLCPSRCCTDERVGLLRPPVCKQARRSGY
jgi:hypothetical protein